MDDSDLEDLLRRLAPQVLGAVVRRYGNFDMSEDATQEALLAAAIQWPRDGLPNQPKAWLITAASRRLIDLLRQDQARRRREDHVASWRVDEVQIDRISHTLDHDDTLILMFMCCHPSLAVASQVALTLRAVGGLTTAEIARAFLVSEETATRRISRAKRLIKESGIPFAMPTREQHRQRLNSVLRVLYLIFNEGYVSTAGWALQRRELAVESLRLTKLIHDQLPDDSEVAGLLALILLTHARHLARTGSDGTLIPMADQDRTKWDRTAIAEGIDLITAALPRGSTGPYQIQAAIAALHDEATKYEDTDWPQIVALYRLLLQIDNNPVITLNFAVAVAMAEGPEAGLEVLIELESDKRVNEGHRIHAVRAHLLEMTGNQRSARDSYEVAAQRALNLQHQRYLNLQAERLSAESSKTDLPGIRNRVEFKERGE